MTRNVIYEIHRYFSNSAVWYRFVKGLQRNMPVT